MKPQIPASPAKRPTRRALLGGRRARSQGQPAPARAATPSGSTARTAPVPSNPGDYEIFLATHATMGFTDSELVRMRAMGGQAWLDEQLDPASIDDSATDTLLQSTPSIFMTGAQLVANYQMNPGAVARELKAATVVRAVNSKRQVLERLMEFWNDLLNVPHDGGVSRILRTLYDQDLRANALSSYEELLTASAKNSAMLSFLDGRSNVVGAPNENYAREVMELHTLGEGVLYTETDVREAARAFTGWDSVRFGSRRGEFLFRANRHDTGQKDLPGLGLTISAGGGVTDGEMVLSHLASLPETIERVSRRLLQWFVVYDPPQSAVDRVTATWALTGGNLRMVVGEVLCKDTVDLCAPWHLPKMKRPLHLAVGLLRQMAPVSGQGSARGLATRFARLGQVPFGWLPPDGYPDTEAAWGTSVLPRWEFAEDLVHNRINGTNLFNAQITALYANVGAQNVGARLNQIMAGGTLDPADEADVQAYVNAAPVFNNQVFRDAIALVASAPSYQRY